MKSKEPSIFFTLLCTECSVKLTSQMIALIALIAHIGQSFRFRHILHTLAHNIGMTLFADGHSHPPARRRRPGGRRLPGRAARAVAPGRGNAKDTPGRAAEAHLPGGVPIGAFPTVVCGQGTPAKRVKKELNADSAF